MDDFYSPASIAEFVGNAPAIRSLRAWIREIKKNPKHPKRVCFLTGMTGCGKSTLARLLLREEGFMITEFLSSDMRLKPGRERLLQYLSFLNVLALFQLGGEERKKRTHKKAALIDCLENMGAASQDLYRSMRNLIKKNKTLGVPVIFTGTKAFRGKRPMNANAVFIHMSPRNKKELEKILTWALEKLNKETPSHAVTHLLQSHAERQEIIERAGGDARRMFKFLEFAANTKKEDVVGLTQSMEKHEVRGPMAGLGRILRHDQPRTLQEVMVDADLEGITMPFGIHGAYLSYVPWAVQQVAKKKKCAVPLARMTSHGWAKVGSILGDYGVFYDKSRNCMFMDFTDIAYVIGSWGPRTILCDFLENMEKYIDEKKDKEEVKMVKEVTGWASPVISWRGVKKILWWVELEKDKRRGDENVELPCLARTFRVATAKRNTLNLSFQALREGVINPRAWAPKCMRRTSQLLRAQAPSTSTVRGRIAKLGAV